MSSDTNTEDNAADREVDLKPNQIIKPETTETDVLNDVSVQARSIKVGSLFAKSSAEGDDGDVGHDEPALAHHERAGDTQPWKLHKYVAKYPILSYFFFLSWFAVCILMVVLIPNLLIVTTKLAFYVPGTLATQNQDAVRGGRADSAWQDSNKQSEQRQQEADGGLELLLIYEAKNGDSLAQRKYLELMDEIEDKVRATTGFEDHCKRVYHGDGADDWACSRAGSITNFFSSSYFKPALNATGYDLEPTVDNYVNFYAQSAVRSETIQVTDKNYDESFVDDIVSYWAAYNKGTKLDGSAAAQYEQKYYNGQEMPPKFSFQQTDNGDARNFSIANLFASHVGKSFASDSPLDTYVDIVMTSFTFGMPLAGYKSSTADIEEQLDDIAEWCFDELHDVFDDFKSANSDEFDFWWQCGKMTQFYQDQVLIGDAIFVIFTLVSVYLVMVHETGSFWLATSGMMMIFLNFAPTILLYRGITGLQYFGTLQVMAVFIILGIGADDVFVIVDSFAQCTANAPDEPLDKRLTATLKHAGKVMLTTSLSTAFSFIGNATSTMPAIYTFGAFAAWLTFVNYCAILVFYPAVLAVYDTYFYTPKLKRGWCINKKSAQKYQQCCFRDNLKVPPTPSRTQTQTQEIDVDGDRDEEELVINEQQRKAKERAKMHDLVKRPIDRWFETTFYRFVMKWRIVILVLTVAVLSVFAGFGAQLKPDTDLPQYFPDGDNYQEFPSKLADNFATENPLRLTADIVWGISGIDRSGTDVTIPDDIGVPIYSDPELGFSTAEETQYLADFCDDLLCQYSDYDCRYEASVYEALKISDPNDYGGEAINSVKCPMAVFRDWVLTDGAASPNITQMTALLADNNVALPPSIFVVCEYFWRQFPIQYPHCWGMLFMLLWLPDELATNNPDYAAGIDNYDYWKEYVWVKPRYDQGGNPFKPDADAKFMLVSAATEAQAQQDHTDGIQLFEDWNTYIANWRDNVPGINSKNQFGQDYVQTPERLTSILVADRQEYIFTFWYTQREIIAEALSGIGWALALAFGILVLATGNWIMAIYSTIIIGGIVICVFGFTVMNGWKLGVVEAVLYVMVVGLSVDYVVHLSEAYLANGEYYRAQRTKRMLGLIGGSIISGAMSTLIGIFWLFFAKIVMFNKFAAFISFVICTSLVLSLLSFTAVLSFIGPEGHQGSILYNRVVKEVSAKARKFSRSVSISVRNKIKGLGLSRMNTLN